MFKFNQFLSFRSMGRKDLKQSYLRRHLSLQVFQSFCFMGQKDKKQFRRTGASKKPQKIVSQILVTGSLLAMAIPGQPALANKSYRVCAEELLETGLSEEVVANACAAALKPGDLSYCVSKVFDNTTEEVEAASILFSCQRVRRPKELAECVIDIQEAIAEASSQIVIDSCRRSLLPERYADCAIGLYNQLLLEPEEILSSCLEPNTLVVTEDN